MSDLAIRLFALGYSLTLTISDQWIKTTYFLIEILIDKTICLKEQKSQNYDI